MIAKPSLREKCSYLVFFWPVFSRIQTRKTPISDTFHTVLCPRFKVKKKFETFAHHISILTILTL